MWSQLLKNPLILLIGKILSKKSFPKMLVKEILSKAWNVVNDVEISVVDRNVFVFSFQHKADVRRAWDRRPWLIKGEHLILKRFSPEHSLAEVEFSTTEFWIQVHDLPLDRHSKENLLKVGNSAGQALETNFIGPSAGFWRRNIRARVEIDINCPLTLGFPLEREHLLDLWIPFKYEKLGNFCFDCGLLEHDYRDCQDKGVQLLLREGVNFGLMNFSQVWILRPFPTLGRLGVSKVTKQRDDSSLGRSSIGNSNSSTGI